MDADFHDFERAVEDWHWWYQVRRDILDLLLSQLKLDPARARLLDIGCGTGGSSVVLSRYGTAVGLDRSLRSFTIAPDRPYSHRVVGNAERLPFGAQTFTAVAALDVLEHLNDDVAGAREIFRVLQPGGAAVIFVPAFDCLWGQNDVHSHHRRRYRRVTLENAVRAAGFDIERIGYFNSLLFLPTWAVRLGERVFPQAARAIEYQSKPTLMNRLLANIFRLELPWIRQQGLPFGTSIFCLARRPS